MLIFCSLPSNTLDAQGLYFLTQCVILKYPKALYITMVHPFLIHLRFLSVLRLCVLKIVRYAILYPWPFETVFIGIILTHSVYKLLFFYFSVRRVRVCRVRERLPVNGKEFLSDGVQLVQLVEANYFHSPSALYIHGFSKP